MFIIIVLNEPVKIELMFGLRVQSNGVRDAPCERTVYSVLTEWGVFGHPPIVTGGK